MLKIKGSFNVAQQPSLFKPFSQNNSFKMAPASLNLNNGKPNLFTNMIVGTYLKTNTVESFDKFITNPTLENFKQIDSDSRTKITQIEKFDSNSF